MTNKYFEFKYYSEQDLVEVGEIINIGDVSPGYTYVIDNTPTKLGEVYKEIHVWMRNISSFDIYRPGLYITHQNYESRTPSSKPDNLKKLRTSVQVSEEVEFEIPRDPFVSVTFKKDGDIIYFDNYNGTLENPIRFVEIQGGLIISRNIICFPIGSSVDFWLRIKNTCDINDGLQKDINDGKWGFALRATGDIHG